MCVSPLGVDDCCDGTANELKPPKMCDLRGEESAAVQSKVAFNVLLHSEYASV